MELLRFTINSHF